MNGLFLFLQGISVWLMGIVGWIFDFITLHGIGDWFRSPGVVLFVTTFLAALIVFIVGFLISITFIWEERKILGRLMDRRGTQVGVLGLFQNFADGLKAFVKEIIIPEEVDVWLYNVAPVILIGISALMIGLIPLSPDFALGEPERRSAADLRNLLHRALRHPHRRLGLQQQVHRHGRDEGRGAADLLRGAVAALAGRRRHPGRLASTSWTSCRRSSRPGYGSSYPSSSVASYSWSPPSPKWSAFPFDLPEAEAELVEGWQTEYGGMRFGLIMLSEYIRGYAASMVAVILFLGGWDGPSFIWPEIWFIIKVFILFAIWIWVRGALMRVTTKQILGIGWKRLMPLALINLAIAIAIKMAGWI